MPIRGRHRGEILLVKVFDGHEEAAVIRNLVVAALNQQHIASEAKPNRDCTHKRAPAARSPLRGDAHHPQLLT